MAKTRTIVLAVGLIALTAACQRISGGGNYAAPLPATPTTPVDGTTLQSLDPNGQSGTGVNGVQGQGADLAGNPIAVPDSAQDISRSDLLGGWKLNAGSDNCMAFMTLTTWSGGYRANTRGCMAPALNGISAWDLNGKQVVLKDGTGQVVALLYSSGAGQFNGQMSTGLPVSLYR